MFCRRLLMGGLYFSLLLAPSSSQLYSGDRKAEYLEMRRVVGKEKFLDAIARCKQLIEAYPDYVYLYETLPEVAQYAAELPDAVKYFESRIEDGREIGLAYFGLGTVYYYMKDYRSAVLCINKAVELGVSAPECFKTFEYAYEKLEGVDAAIRFFNLLCHRNPENANYRYAVALAYWNKHDYQKVLEAIAEAMRLSSSEPKYCEVKEAILLRVGTDPETTTRIAHLMRSAEARADLAGLQFLRSHVVQMYGQACQWDSVVSIVNRVVKEASEFGLYRWQGWALMRLADTDFYLGNYKGSLLWAQRTLSTGHLVSDFELLFAGLIAKLRAHLELGNLNEALETAFERLRLVQGRGHDLDLIRVLADVALTYHEMGVDETGMDYALEALSTADHSGADPDLLFQVHNTVGLIHEALGHNSAAPIHYRIAHRLVSKAHNWAGNSVVAYGLLGNSYLKLGEPGKAKALFYKQLSIARNKGFKGEEADALANLGNYYFKTKQYSMSKTFFRRALDQARRVERRAIALTCARGLARLAEITGNAHEALALYGRVLDLGDMPPSHDIVPFSYSRLVSSVRNDYFQYVRILCSLGRFEEAFEAAEKRKVLTGIGQSMLYERGVTELLPDSSRMRLRQIKLELERKHSQLADNGADKLATSKIGHCLSIRNDIENLELEYRKITRTFRASNPKGFDGHTVSSLSIRRLQHLLAAKDRAILEYVVGDTQTVVFLVKRDTLLHYTIKKSRNELAELLAQVSCVFNATSPREQVWNAALADFNMRGSAELFDVLVRPFEKDLCSINSVIVVADDLLKQLPFEVLVMQAPANGSSDFLKARFMVEQFEVSYILAAALLDYRFKEARRPPKFLLALGNPMAALNDAATTGSRLPNHGGADIKYVQTLPGARKEIDHIRQIFGDHADVLVGEQATKASFKELAAKYRILHLAAHASLDDDRPMYSSVHLASVRGGLEKGDLRAFELLNMELQADLAILSGCNTGRVRRVEGMEGFVRGFMFAGVPSVVSALWSVEDDATAELMGNFYRYLSRGERKSRALQLAKLDLIKSGKADPFYWGAFVLVGDPSPITLSAPTKPQNWKWLMLAALVVGATIPVLKGKYRSLLRSVFGKE